MGYAHIQGYRLTIPLYLESASLMLYEPVDNIAGYPLDYLDLEYSQADDERLLSLTKPHAYWWTLRGAEIIQNIPSLLDITDHLRAYEEVVTGRNARNPHAAPQPRSTPVPGSSTAPRNIFPDIFRPQAPTWQKAFNFDITLPNHPEPDAKFVEVAKDPIIHNIQCSVCENKFNIACEVSNRMFNIVAESHHVVQNLADHFNVEYRAAKDSIAWSQLTYSPESAKEEMLDDNASSPIGQ